MDVKEKRRESKFAARLSQKRDKENKRAYKSNDIARPLYTSSEKGKSSSQKSDLKLGTGTDQVLTCLSDRNLNYAATTLEEWGVFSVGWDEIHGDLFHLDGRSHEMGQKYCGIYEKEVDSQLESAFDTIEIEDIDSCDEMEYDLDSYERYTPKYDRDVNTWTSFAMCHVDVESPGSISTFSGDFPMEYFADDIVPGTSPPSTGNTIDTSTDSLMDGANSKNGNTTLEPHFISLDSDGDPVDFLNDNLPKVTDAQLREQNCLRDKIESTTFSTTSHLHNMNNDEIERTAIDNR
ncbi:uncharacterized protein LOC135483342 [Lineus longissimus]|uniref:uncharacterized protein LOC135483342 n=1 Tax=Lineus longissimus TaxID=88925 RepID=UPI002B4F2A40